MTKKEPNLKERSENDLFHENHMNRVLLVELVISGSSYNHGLWLEHAVLLFINNKCFKNVDLSHFVF